MAYQEMEQVLDTKQAKLTEHITVWNLLGLIGGAILGVGLMQVTGVGLIAPIPVAIGIGLTIRRRNMLMAQRGWVYALFLVQRWLGKDEIAYLPPRRQVARERQVVLLQRMVDGHAVFGMQKEE